MLKFMHEKLLEPELKKFGEYRKVTRELERHRTVRKV